jgi:hypothetical protein
MHSTAGINVMVGVVIALGETHMSRPLLNVFRQSSFFRSLCGSF